MSSLVVALADGGDRLAVMGAAVARASARSCAAMSSLEREILVARPDIIVYEPGAGLATRPDLIQLIETLGIRVIVRLPLTRRAVAELFALAKALPSVGVSIRPSETAGAMIATIAEPDSGPVGLTLSRVVDVIPDDGLRLVLGALALGRHRCDAAQHSSLFGLRPRTLQLHHQRIGLPHPQRLRSWGRAVWTAWRLERWNFTCKQAALSGGFDRASALADALRPVLGTTPRGLIVDGGVDRVIYRLRLELSHGHCGIVAPADVPKARPSAASTDSDAGRFRPPTYDVDETVTVPC